MALRGSGYVVFRPDVWSAYVKFYFKKKLYAANHFMNFSGDVRGGGKQVDIPHITRGPDAGTLTQTTGAITDNTITETRTQLTIATWKYSSRLFTDFQEAQIASKYNVQAAYAEDIAQILAEDLDTALLGQGTEVYPRVGNSATNLGTTTIEGAIRITETYSIPFDGLAFFFHPNAFWGELMQNQKYYDASQWGKGVASSGQNQPVGTLYGMPTYVSAQVPVGTAGAEAGHRNLLVHKRSIVFALSNIDGTDAGPRVQVQGAADALARRVVGDILYGVKTTDNFGGVRIISNT